MNKQIIFIIILALLVVVALYLIYQQNQNWKKQLSFNQAVIDRFPELKESLSSSEKDFTDKLKESEKMLSDKAENLIKEVTKEEIDNFCKRIKGMERLEDNDDIQFYQNNKDLIEEELQRIHSLEQKPKKTRHGKDCTCEICQSKKTKPNTSEQ